MADKHLLHLRAEVLDARQDSGPWIFMPIGVLMPVSSMSRRFSTGMVQVLVRPGNWSFSSISLDQLFVGHAGPPLLARLQHDGGVVHIERRVVGGAFRPADGAEHALRLREKSGSCGPAPASAATACVMEMPGSAVGM